jgi:hypothetical protein
MISLIRAEFKSSEEPLYTLANIENGKLEFLADCNDGSVWWTTWQYVHPVLLGDAGIKKTPPIVSWEEILDLV